MAGKLELEIGIAAAIAVLSFLVYLMYREAIKPSWGEVSRKERQARKDREAKK